LIPTLVVADGLACGGAAPGIAPPTVGALAVAGRAFGAVLLAAVLVVVLFDVLPELFELQPAAKAATAARVNRAKLLRITIFLLRFAVSSGLLQAGGSSSITITRPLAAGRY
jgi:hypothetical protein